MTEYVLDPQRRQRKERTMKTTRTRRKNGRDTVTVEVCGRTYTFNAERTSTFVDLVRLYVEHLGAAWSKPGRRHDNSDDMDAVVGAVLVAGLDADDWNALDSIPARWGYEGGWHCLTRRARNHRDTMVGVIEPIVRGDVAAAPSTPRTVPPKGLNIVAAIHRERCRRAKTVGHTKRERIDERIAWLDWKLAAVCVRADLHAMTYDEAGDLVGECEQSAAEIESEHRGECAAFGDSWPGAAIQVGDSKRRVALMRSAMESHPGRAAAKAAAAASEAARRASAPVDPDDDGVPF